MSDASMAVLARHLAEALMDAAHSRDPDDKKRVAQLQTDLCAEWRAEQAEKEKA